MQAHQEALSTTSSVGEGGVEQLENGSGSTTSPRLETLSVRELKALLDERRVDYRDCVEKSDLIRCARETAHIVPPTAKTTDVAVTALDVRTFDSTPPEPPEWVVIALHGFGANKDDLVPMGKAAVQQIASVAATRGLAAPCIRFVHPNAHLPMNPTDTVGRMWWPIDFSALFVSFLSGEVTRAEVQGLDVARKLVVTLIEKIQQETGLPLSRFVLAGFSQGAILATDVALHLPEPPAALCIFSGVLQCENIWKPLIAKRGGMKVLQSHGTQDPLLPQILALQLKTSLEAAGIVVDFVSFEGGHTIPPEALARFSQLLLSLSMPQSG